MREDKRQVRCLQLFPALAESAFAPRTGTETGGKNGTEIGGKRGIYLWGGVGTGKSMLLELLYEGLPVQKKRWVHFHSFMLDVHQRMHRHRQEHRGDPLPAVAARIARETEALFLDEFQVPHTHTTQHTHTHTHTHQVVDPADAILLRRLFSTMIDLGVWVALSSNTAPERLYEQVMVVRVGEQCESVSESGV